MEDIPMKEKKIEDYIHLYLGCEVVTPLKWDKKFILTGVQGGWTGDKIPIVSVEDMDKQYNFNINEIKLLLRPLSSMTEEEKLELFEIQYGEDKYQALSLQFAIATDSLSAEALHYLLSKGFDVFKLIPAKLALDKTLVKN